MNNVEFEKLQRKIKEYQEKIEVLQKKHVKETGERFSIVDHIKKADVCKDCQYYGGENYCENLASEYFNKSYITDGCVEFKPIKK